MRGIRKPCPPGDVSPDGQPARTFTEAEQTCLEDLKGLVSDSDKTRCARGHFDRLDKSKLRAVMLREQHHLCIYCERRLGGNPIPHIDHWRPLSRNPDLALHWKNLHLSCANAETCDSAKGDQPLRCDASDPDLPWPTECKFERYVGFTSGGEMYVRNDVGIAVATHRGLCYSIGETVLNLNAPALIAARKAAIDSEKSGIARRFKEKTASKTDRDKIADDMLKAAPWPAFVSIRVAWLCKLLGAGRS
ncbi:MAG: hypothetical protein HQL64_09710 [Magnetococcales bacterium]|nr:hypothetical protein [Magnetococcales bacterium]